MNERISGPASPNPYESGATTPIEKMRYGNFKWWVLTALFVGISVVFIFINFDVGTARNGRESLVCEANLESIYNVLAACVAETGDLPRDTNGEFRLSLLSMSVLVEPCDAQSLDDLYLVAPNLTAACFAERETNHVIICDKPGNHVLRSSNGLVTKVKGRVQEQAILLHSNGHTRYWRGDSSVYAAWAIDFAAGLNDDMPPY